MLYPVCVSVAGASAVSVDAHHLLYTIHFLEPVHDEFDITTVVDAKLYRIVEDALVGGDSDAVDVDVELVGDDLGHIEVHTLAVYALDLTVVASTILPSVFRKDWGEARATTRLSTGIGSLPNWARALRSAIWASAMIDIAIMVMDSRVCDDGCWLVT